MTHIEAILWCEENRATILFRAASGGRSEVVVYGRDRQNLAVRPTFLEAVDAAALAGLIRDRRAATTAVQQAARARERVTG